MTIESCHAAAASPAPAALIAAPPAEDSRGGLGKTADAWDWRTNAALEIEFLSANAVDWLGYNPDELRGSRLDSLTATEADANRLNAFLHGRLAFNDLDLLLSRRDGSPGLFRLQGAPLICPTSGAFLGFEGDGSDLTDPTAREETLRRLIESTEAANRAKREFIANISHELRTPLNAIIGFSEIMAGEGYGPLGDERYKSYAEFTLESANHLLKLINDLLDVAKIEAGRLVLREDAIDPRELLQAALRIISERSDATGPAVEHDIPPGLPIIQGDECKLKQVLINLIGNAVKFTPANEQVLVSVRQEPDGRLCFIVSDNGIGMAPEDIATAFAPFGQVQRDPSSSGEGSGLGLPLAKALIELHGGSLELTSEIGRGTIVTVRLPAWRSRPREA